MSRGPSPRTRDRRPLRRPGARPARGLAPVVLLALALGTGAPPVGASADVAVAVTAVAGADVKELKATGTIAAPPRVVRAIVADLDRYASFMPYVSESRIVGRAEAGDVLNYQRLSFGIPFVRDRHYVIRLTERRYLAPDGRPAYRMAWRIDGSVALPSDPAAIPVELNYGYWDLQAQGPTGETTAAEYCVFTDSGGSLPKWIVHQAHHDAIPRLFEAVRAAVTDPRYATQPAPPTPVTAALRPDASPGCRPAASP
jgi:hypothetical protein